MARKKRTWSITHDQLDDLEELIRHIGGNVSEITALCHSDDIDITRGYRLGSLHTYLSTNWINLQDLLSEVQDQENKNPNALAKT